MDKLYIIKRLHAGKSRLCQNLNFFHEFFQQPIQTSSESLISVNKRDLFMLQGSKFSQFSFPNFCKVLNYTWQLLFSCCTSKLLCLKIQSSLQSDNNRTTSLVHITIMVEGISSWGLRELLFLNCMHDKWNRPHPQLIVILPKTEELLASAYGRSRIFLADSVMLMITLWVIP